MKTTTPKKLRSELKSYLDQATKEPIKVKRRSGNNFIIISEERYFELTGAPLPPKKQSTPPKGSKKKEVKVKATKKTPATKVEKSKKIKDKKVKKVK
jgi:hypothetical protein